MYVCFANEAGTPEDLLLQAGRCGAGRGGKEQHRPVHGSPALKVYGIGLHQLLFAAALGAEPVGSATRKLPG